VLVILNGLSPYLGLKTQSDFTMYSNLQTEAGHWNHELLPEGMRVFHFQDHLVRIVASSDPELAEAADRDREWVLFALRDWANDHPDASLTYELDGTVHTAPHVGDDPVLGDAPNPVLSKLFLFRDVPPASGNSCRIHRGGPQQGS